jgi:hypothetical protein
MRCNRRLPFIHNSQFNIHNSQFVLACFPDPIPKSPIKKRTARLRDPPSPSHPCIYLLTPGKKSL